MDTVDSAAAEKVPGVERIVRLKESKPPSGFAQLGGVAVLATSTWAAIQGRKALKLTWKDGPNAGYDSVRYRAEIERTSRRPGRLVRNQGDVGRALRGVAKQVQADYYRCSTSMRSTTTRTRCRTTRRPRTGTRRRN